MEHTYQQYFDAMPGFVTVQDRNLKILQTNARFRQKFGEWEGRHCYQVYKQQAEQCEKCPVQRTFRDGDVHRHEGPVTAPDGTEYWMVVTSSPIKDDQGNVVAVMKSSTNITDIKSAQEQLRDSQSKYRLLFEEVPCFISIQDRDLHIVQANRMHRETFGTSFGGMCYKVYKHRETACLPCVVQQTFRDGKFHTTEEVVTSETGQPINVLVNTAPIKDGGGEIDRVIEMSTDITKIRQLQDKLTSIGLLIGSISHTIKGLLNGLDGGIYLVNTGLKKNNRERIDQGWQIALRNVDRIRTLVLNILHYAKDRELVWEPIRISEFLADVCKVVETKAKELDIAFNYEIEQDAGQLEGDVQSLRSVLINLLENALDACRTDTKECAHQVTIKLTGDKKSVAIDIADNGIGMDRETREKAFSLFFSSKGAGGTGLGLFIADKIIKSHGGRVDIEAKLGEGSHFTLTLPRKRPTGDQPKTEQDILSTSNDEEPAE
jgi:PAS domain S-box-containing protein